MKQVKVNKNELLDVIKKNKDAHITEYNEMMLVYKKEVFDKIQDLLIKNKDRVKGFKTSISVTEPECHSEEYDTILSMLKMSVDETITLDYNEYKNYVRDEWHWARAFAASKSIYLN